MPDQKIQSNLSKEADIEKRYMKAKALEQGSFIETMVLNAQIYPNWIGNSTCFWYIQKRRISENGLSEIRKQFRLVNALTTENTEAFDHHSLARALGRVTKRDISANNLPISEIKIELSPLEVRFMAFDKQWSYNASEALCTEIAALSPYWLVSPDGKKAAFLRNFNLWVRDLDSGVERSLTQDGELHYAYAVQPERVNLVGGMHDVGWVNKALPEAHWSSDSKRLLTMRVDERRVLSLPITEYVPSDGSLRPRCTQVKYALPGDRSIAEYELLAIEVDTGNICLAKYQPIPDSVLWAGLFSGNRAWWSSDNTRAFFVDMSRGQRQAKVVSFNITTGLTEVLFKETAETYIDLSLDFENPASLLPVYESNELIWFSERSGWAHIYLYDLDNGNLKKDITNGNWLVREVLHFDSASREVLIQIAGRVDDRDPYYREICRVNVDTGVMSTLVSGDYDCICHKPNTRPHQVGMMFGQATNECAGVSPNGDYLVITRTRADEPPITELFDRDGKLLLTIEAAEISGLPEGWRWPEPVELLAADGKTSIYGLIFRPSDFSADKDYPVLDWAVSNPFYGYVPKGSFGNDTENGYAYMSAAAYSELGFITVIIDGRGSCYRSKAFHDESYGRVHTASNLEDHIEGIRQLAKRYPYMDLTRVGIVDTSGSNAPAYGVMAYPEFYKVAAVISTWDVRLLTQGEIYQGVGPKTDYEASVLGNMVSNLEGKLLLIHGMQDNFFQVSGVLQLVEALIRENKDFDLVLLPNGGHAWSSSHYGVRRVWDYIVRHLLDIEPPTGVHVASGVEYALKKLNSEDS